ncbi:MULTISPECIES: xanthine dehydrogenase accessory protein XdhC [Delftia]|uniref:xanthine dehydrogenase accessory protein XdhC n=1 Tax=Delftia TaxID=80865 RepID=UPI000927C661|nr:MULTISPECIES: xanthine dehydrogenase accessory protein XdhC [Delftia]MCO5338051.1 xanthine dehydrogenase accessory protein XdhC [Delftia tsuruhatensis]MCR4545175.1 xanthine dehydrogenase accessory protein XdhC [Delftia tsuruhatensis]MDH0419782.1 xanthine dehydrogenase accessory protein XdhC [Delftia tsuruhatensis]OJX24107.1 MAG: xanthine dehydrogenase accessory protein XdhC [Delftia sp. 67-8]QFS67037.1 xanthine dehydrogenase accessory protein XdhC [Delftia tsuruhatensis]
MWSDTFNKVEQGLAQGPLCWVEVMDSRGSVPRERGAWMAVFADRVAGTIGGGHLEFDAIDRARSLLRGWATPGEQGSQGGQVATEHQHRYPLGPSLGQCCGGVVMLRFVLVPQGRMDMLRERLQPPRDCVALFGAGHVGHALVRLLCNLPYRVMWVDSRDSVFPEEEHELVQCEYSDPVQSAVADLPAGSQVLIMSFSHAEDLEVVAQCLGRQRQHGDLPYVGLIGSATKWATFRRRLRERGFSDAELDHVTCPIGVPGIKGKEPEVIAVAVAAQLLQRRSAAPTRNQGNL